VSFSSWYLQTKFGIDASDTHSIRMLVQSYLQGLCWVLTYYHKFVKLFNYFVYFIYNLTTHIGAADHGHGTIHTYTRP